MSGSAVLCIGRAAVLPSCVKNTDGRAFMLTNCLSLNSHFFGADIYTHITQPLKIQDVLVVLEVFLAPKVF